MSQAQPRREWALAVLALLFLAAYAWPILDPNLGSTARRTSATVVWAVWVAFVVDYALGLIRADDRRSWIVHHLLDLAVLILPVLRPLRLLRLVVLVRVLNRSAANSFRGRVGVYVASGSLLLAFVAALAVLDAERDAPGANIVSFGDAMWWACTTMTTVGYGDTYPTTVTGRLIGVALMVAGIGLLGTVTATLASWLVETVAAEAAGATVDAMEDSDRPDQADLSREISALREQVARLTEAVERPSPPGDR